MSSTYGLVVDTTGLPTLPSNVNEPDSKSGIGASSYDPPIHVLSLPQFSKLHLQHILTHPPDSVLFPFLHGLEGENEAQNTFFISSTHSGTTTPRKPTYGAVPGNHAPAGADANGIPHSLHHFLAQKEKVKIKPLPPKYRGLVWVVCEEDLDKPLPVPGSPLPPPTSSPVPSSPAQSPGSSPRSPGRAATRKPALAPHARHYIRELAVLRRKKEGGFGDAAFAPPHVPPEALPYPHIGGFVQEPPHSAMYTSTGEDTSDSDYDYDDDDSEYDDEDYEDDDVEDDAEITLDTPTSASLEVADMAAAAKAGGQDSHPHQPMDDSVRVVDQDSINSNNRQDEQVIAMDIDVDVDMSNNPPPTTIFTRESGAPSPSPPSSQDGEGEDKEVDRNEGMHMHPVVQRPALQHRDHTVTPATIDSITPSIASSATAVENGHAEPASPNSVNEKEVKHKKSRSNSLHSSISQDPRDKDPTLSLLTSTFRPCEIIRRVPGSTYKEGEDGEWEFVPLKVPDGISLRNFGIQVPIYSTISDIVVYSPHGPSSPNAQRLARRIRQAIRRKLEERAERAKAMGWSDEALGLQPLTSESKPEEAQDQKPKEDVLLKYNVFLLDADDDSMRGYSLYSPTPSVSTTTSPQPPAHIPDVAKQAMEATGYASNGPSFGTSNYPGLSHIMVRVCGGSSGAPITFSGSPPIPGTHSDSSSRSGSTINNVPIIDTSPSTTTSNVTLSVSPSSMSPAPALTGPGAPGDMEMNVLTALEERGPAAVNVGGAHTDRSDGHLVEMRDEERMEVDKDAGGRSGEDTSMEVDIEHRAMNVSTEDGSKLSLASISDPRLERKRRRSNSPNTVDFAQREKEEMRDLTKASEIIGLLGNEWEPSLTTSGPPPSMPSFSIPDIVKMNLEGEVVKVDIMNEKEKAEQLEKARQHRSLLPTTWDSKIGQIFLGNAEDVPLLPELPPQSHPSSNYPGSPSSPSSARNPVASPAGLSFDDPFLYTPSNDPRRGMGFDICIECHDLAPFPSMTHMRAAEEHLSALDLMWAERCAAAVTNPSFREELSKSFGESDQAAAGASDQAHTSGRVRNVAIPIPARPPPNANAVIHLPMPSSPPNTQATIAQLMPLIKFLERWIKPVEGDDKPRIHVSVASPASTPSPVPPADDGKSKSAETPAPRRWSSMMSAFPSLPGISNPTPHIQRNRSLTSPTPTTPPPATYQPSPSFYPPNPRTRPLKILLYSADGYTESSVPALSMLMAMKRLLLPEAYLELQVEKKRSFFVYQADLGLLKRVEMRLREERDREAREKERAAMEKAMLNGNGKRVAEGSLSPIESHRQPRNSINDSPTAGQPRRMAAKSVSFAQPPTIPPPVPPTRTPTGNPTPGGQAPTTTTQPGRSPPMTVPSTSSLPSSEPSGGQGAPGASSYSAPTSASPTPTEAQPPSAPAVKGRPRAMTSPWLPSLFGGDHQSWFNDPRFDGSFPSRVLPFLYLGNLNHAANAYMLHALGITHVVSVGECALVPPPGYGSGYTHPSYVGPTSSSPYHRPGPGAHYVPGKGPGQGSLWLEEREGRIKVLDIKGVCDDGIDTLEPQLEPICDWIDQARAEGGQVLVHCRVGVSRSATVTIAYVMKHLGLSLVDAYLIVRSRRLSVLIQPNMRLLYNLCGWEIKLAKERAGDDENKLKKELARTLSWPYLAKEVHALNEKYLH